MTHTEAYCSPIDMAAATEEVAESQAASSDLQADAAKKRLKRPVKPNVEEHKAAVDQLQDELNKRRDRSEALRGLIDQKRGQSGGGPEAQAARNKLNEFSTSFKTELVSEGIARVLWVGFHADECDFA